MNFEKYGNKLDKLLYEIEKRLPSANTDEVVQIGGGDGPEPTTTDENGGIYSKILSYSVNHVSVLVHLDKIQAQAEGEGEGEDGNINASVLENPQISYNNVGGTIVSEYSIEQQLRLGCDNKGDMYNYSIVLTRRIKTEEEEDEDEDEDEDEVGENKVKESLGKLGVALNGLSETIKESVGE